jgi:hypothetical protein
MEAVTQALVSFKKYMPGAYIWHIFFDCNKCLWAVITDKFITVFAILYLRGV